MSNFDKMVKMNQEASRAKASCAKVAIEQMLEREELVSVCALMKETGFSRGFFYQNSEVKSALDDARMRQSGMIFHRKRAVVLDKAMERQIHMYEKQIENLKKENACLVEKCEKLEAASRKKDLAILKSL